ncbi:uncharacterized protein LOC131954122 [Physella acuta]|uniref:uncharacterized protein LOC131954122 n=1 Tax=Physella acuta TaxID=109671 RepID=UPI0027DC1DA4|nr:uncharacterized protein LOC131954122 [Physella acuta]
MVNPAGKLHNVPTVNVIMSTSSMLTTSTPSVSSTSKPSMLASTTTKSNMPSDNKPGVSTVNKYSVVTSETTKAKERSPEIQKPSTANTNVLFEKAQNQDQPLFKLNPNITALKKKPGTDSSTPPKDLQTSSNVNTPKSFLSMFGNFDKETSDEEETAPSSIFKLFNFSGNTRDKNENSPQPSQTPFGKFMDTPDSDTDSEKGPTSLFNLFHKTGNWESGESGFTINFNAEKDGANAGGSTLFQEEDGTDKKGLFNFGAADDSFDGERPMFNLF